MIKGKFQFYPVGHGLFYTGQINKFNFVFDCGGGQSITIAVDDYKRNILEDYKLDILFISHLHNDHINGIPNLLKSINNNCERVILPYFTPFQRLFLVAEYLFGGDDPNDPNNPDSPSRELNINEVLQIIENPHSYFLKKGVSVIYVGSRGDKNDNYYYDDNDNKGGDDNEKLRDLFLKPDIKTYNDSESFYKSEGKDISRDNGNKGTISFLEANRIKLDRFWEFIVYNGKLDDSKIIKFKNKVNEKFISLIGENNDITAENLNKIISNNEILNDLAKIYGELFKSKINDYGLMLIHRPVLAKRRFIEFEFSDSKSCYREIDCFCDCDCHCHCHRHYRRYNKCCKPFSTLLTGDRGLKFLLENDNSDITPELKGVNIFQVPHHGSKTNWKEIKEVDGENSILKQFNDRICKFAIIPCNNTEKFPSPIVLKDIISHFFDIRIVNDIPYKYAINIRNH